jgi:hypothetical protein
LNNFNFNVNSPNRINPRKGRSTAAAVFLGAEYIQTIRVAGELKNEK